MFDVHQSIFDEHGEQDSERADDYIHSLMDEFADSPEADPIFEEIGDIGWAASMMEFCINYIGEPPPEMSLIDFEEVVFELFPRKVSVDPEAAPEIIKELTAFWKFLDRQYDLPNAKQILSTLDESAAERLEQELSNPSNFGMAKSFVMGGKEAGFDMTSQAGLDQFMLAFNSSLLGGGPTEAPAAKKGLPRSSWQQLGTSSQQAQEKRRKKRKAEWNARKRQRNRK